MSNTSTSSYLIWVQGPETRFLCYSCQYYIVYHLPAPAVSQLLIGSVHYYCEIGAGAEKLKSVKYNSRQASSAPGKHTPHTQSFSVKSDTDAHKLMKDGTQVGTQWVWSHLRFGLPWCENTEAASLNFFWILITLVYVASDEQNKTASHMLWTLFARFARHKLWTRHRHGIF